MRSSFITLFCKWVEKIEALMKWSLIYFKIHAKLRLFFIFLFFPFCFLLLQWNYQKTSWNWSYRFSSWTRDICLIFEVYHMQTCHIKNCQRNSDNFERWSQTEIETHWTWNNLYIFFYHVYVNTQREKQRSRD